MLRHFFHETTKLASRLVGGKDTTGFGTEVILAIRCPCNYSCYYCVAGNAPVERTSTFAFPKLEDAYSRLKPLVVTSLECGRGEPALHPQIQDILETCTRHGMVSVPTNNSISPSKWMPRTHPERLLVRAALHPSGEENLNLFLQHLLDMRDLSAHARVEFVAHPGRVKRIEYYRDFFSQHGFEMVVTPFIGNYLGKEYPGSYSSEERSAMGLDEKGWYGQLVPDLVVRDFAGIPCLAGFRSIYIAPDGGMRRCLYDSTILAKPYGRAVPCSVKHCGCGLLLEELNTVDDATFWNFWRRLAGLELLHSETSLTPEQVYQQKRAKYWELMQRYGKCCEKTV